MTTLFQIAVGHDVDTKAYSAIVHCLPDNQIARVPDNENLRVVLAAASKLVRKKTQIINPTEANGNRGLIVLPR